MDREAAIERSIARNLLKLTALCAKYDTIRAKMQSPHPYTPWYARCRQRMLRAQMMNCSPYALRRFAMQHIPDVIREIDAGDPDRIAQLDDLIAQFQAENTGTGVALSLALEYYTF